jgi:hypothetical protein
VAWTGTSSLAPTGAAIPTPRTASSGEQVGQEPDLPAPPPGDVLTGLPPVQLSALDIALKRFLAGLEQAEAPPFGGHAGAGWYPWLVAAAAAAAAGEVARRQMRLAAAQRPEIHGLPDASLDPPPAE